MANPLSSNKLSHFFKVTLVNVAKDTNNQIQQAQLFMVASSLAYTTVLSIVPVLAVSFAIFKAFGGLQKLYNILIPLILSNLTQGSSDEAIATLHKFIDNTNAGAIGATGLIGLIFTSMSMFSSAENAINHIWLTPVTRSLFSRISAYWIFITLGPLALSVLVGIATSSNLPMSRYFPSGTGLSLIGVGIFFCIYKWVPQTKVKSRYALIAATISAFFWHLAGVGYSYYNRKVVSYNAVYGSLGAIPVFLIWIYIGWIILLFGAALTAALQKRMKQFEK